ACATGGVAGDRGVDHDDRRTRAAGRIDGAALRRTPARQRQTAERRFGARTGYREDTAVAASRDRDVGGEILIGPVDVTTDRYVVGDRENTRGQGDRLALHAV